MELSFHLAHEELALQRGRGVWGTPAAATALGTGLAQLWMSPVPGQLGRERVRLAHHVPAPCSGSLPQQQDEACSHSLHPLGRQLAVQVWDWQEREGCPWLPRSADLAGFFPDHTGRTCCHSQARGGLCCPAMLCKGTSFAFLPARKKVTCITFFTLKALQKPPSRVTVGF